MIELELWYLVLLPLLFAAGWWLRGFDAKQRSGDADGGPRAYFRGLNYLLNEQPDKAIDAFVEVVKLDPETIDLHFALGNLFRRRGEVDRAVRIHTHLLNRADLPSRSRAEALAELGHDYLKGGLLDRAEDTFTRLLDEPRHRVDALRALAAHLRDGARMGQGDRHCAAARARGRRKRPCAAGAFSLRSGRTGAGGKGRRGGAAASRTGAEDQPQVGARRDPRRRPCGPPR